MIDADRMFPSSAPQPTARPAAPTLATAPTVPAKPAVVEDRLFPSSTAQAVAVAAAPADAEEARALRMFKSSMPQPASEAAATLATDDAAGGDPATVGKDSQPDQIVVPREVAELRSSDPERVREEKLYGGTPHDAIVAAVEADVDIPKNMRTKDAAIEWSKIARDIGIDDADTRYVTQRIGQLRLERATGDAPITRESALKKTMDALGRQFDDPVKAFNEAAKLARRDFRVAHLLDRTGLGNDAETIVMLAKRAMSERARGRLK